ncbi:MAG: hypothetical protein ABI566_06315 [Pseudolysinimonas sp.]
MRRRRWLSFTALAVLVASITGATAGVANAAQAASAEPPPYTLVFTTPSLSVEYGTPWTLEAYAENANNALAPFVTTGTLTGAPSGYTPLTGSYMPDPFNSVAYMAGSGTQGALPAGSYTATLTLSPFGGANEGAVTNPPAQLTITPAALGIVLQVAADPSNPANAILSARFTGAVTESFFSTVDPTGPLTPAGTWTVRVLDSDAAVAHEFSVERTDTDDVLAVSSYWSDVAPGAYTAQATFVPAGDSAENFTITDASPVTYTAAAAPGSGSTAPPAPPAPPASEPGGMTLPLWIPIAAGVLSAGLLALLIVQIVRLRRTGSPAVTA